MALLKQFLNNTRSKLDGLEYGGEPRPYLGMSQIGHHCSKYLWFKFHWVLVAKHNSRLERIFNVGHLFEPQIVKQLKEAGMEVFRVEDGKEVEHFGYPNEPQEEYVGFAGHSKGHSDGRIRGVVEAPEIDHLLEIKTMKESKFKEISKNGLKKSNEVYYGQTQRYMNATGLEWCLFIAMNKNTCQIYIERVPYIKEEAHELVRKENMVIMSDLPPNVSYHDGYYKCNYCDQKDVCKKEVMPTKNCRSCDHSDMENDGVWTCTIQKKNLTLEEQRIGCESYKLGWGLE